METEGVIIFAGALLTGFNAYVVLDSFLPMTEQRVLVS